MWSSSHCLGFRIFMFKDYTIISVTVLYWAKIYNGSKIIKFNAFEIAVLSHNAWKNGPN